MPVNQALIRYAEFVLQTKLEAEAPGPCFVECGEGNGETGRFPVYWGTEESQEDFVRFHKTNEKDPSTAASLLIARVFPHSAGYLDLSRALESQARLAVEKAKQKDWKGSERIPDPGVILQKAAAICEGRLKKNKTDADPAATVLQHTLLPEGDRQRNRAAEMHKLGYGSQTDRVEIIHCYCEDLLIAWLEWRKLFTERRKCRVLLIDDNVKARVAGRDSLLKMLCRTLCEYEGVDIFVLGTGDKGVSREELASLQNKLVELETRGSLAFGPVKLEARRVLTEGRQRLASAEEEDLQTMDLILLDLHFDKEQGSNSSGASAHPRIGGKDLLPLFTNVLPQVPVFILTKSRDFEDVRDCIADGADAFIQKEYSWTFPAAYVHFLKRTGRLLLHFTDKPDLRRQLLGNLRYWRFKKDLLWYGDKCYHMIGHSYSHIANVWNTMNEVLGPVLDHYPWKIEDEENLFVLAMAVWLHDIGHKGTARYGEAFQIRERHGLLSAELILDNPNLYGIWTEKDPERRQRSPYYGCRFGPPDTAIEQMRHRVLRLTEELNTRESAMRARANRSDSGEEDRSRAANRELDTFTNEEREELLMRALRPERIALLCIFHQSNSVLYREDCSAVRSEKRVPTDLLAGGRPEGGVYSLEDICELTCASKSRATDNILLKLACLLRAVDATDQNKVRVGDANEEEGKKAGLARDLAYQLYQLSNLVDSMADQLSLQAGARQRFRHLFYDVVVDDICKNQGLLPETRESHETWLTTNAQQLNLEAYDTLVDYIEFICVQGGHFDLHNAIDSLQVRYLSCANTFEFVYNSNRTEEWLKSTWIKQKGDAQATRLSERLLGWPSTGKREERNPGYARKDYLRLKDKGLKHWFSAEDLAIFLHTRGSAKLEPDVYNP